MLVSHIAVGSARVEEQQAVGFGGPHLELDHTHAGGGPGGQDLAGERGCCQPRPCCGYCNRTLLQ